MNTLKTIMKKIRSDKLRTDLSANRKNIYRRNTICKKDRVEPSHLWRKLRKIVKDPITIETQNAIDPIKI